MENKTESKTDSLVHKIYTIIVFVVLLSISLMFVLGTIQDRTKFKLQAIDKVAQRWAMAQCIKPPKLILNGAKDDQSLSVVEQKYDIQIENSTQKENIFTVPVYIANIKNEGMFNLQGKKDINGVINLSVTDFKGFVGNPKIKINGKEILPDEDGIYKVNLKTNEKLLKYELEYQLRGTQQIEVNTANIATYLKLVSTTTPTIIGKYSPFKTNVDAKSYTGEWSVSKLAATSSDKTALSTVIGAYFVKKVDNYRAVERSVKYGFLFISLTFLTFFVFEVKNKRHKIHPFQYALIGISMVIFYLLLLSMSEFFNFTLSYLIAALMTIGLISGYTYFVLTKKDDKKFPTLIGGFLALIYGYLYMTINLEQYALLFGSFGLFFTILIVMYATRNIRWYTQSEEENLPQN